MKVKKLWSILLSGAMAASLVCGAYAAPPGDAPGGEAPGGPGGMPGGGAQEVLTLEDPKYQYKVIENVTSIADVVSEDNLTGLARITTGATVNGEKISGLLTMTKNGKEVPVAAGTYTAADKVVVAAANYLQSAGEDGRLAALGSWNAISGLPYRTALSVKNGALQDSAASALQGGKYDKSGMDGVSVEAATSGISAVIVQDSDYTIKNANISMLSNSDGTDVNDFAGYGAAVAVFGDSKVEIEDSEIVTQGVAKAGAFADSGADLIIRGSSLETKGGTIYKDYRSTANQSYMINPPWVLGIAGSARATNVMGEGTTGTYVDSSFTASDWGAVSIDSGSLMHLTLVNSDVNVKGSGYGAYAIGTGTIEDYYGASFDVNTYAVIMTGAEVNLNSVKKGDKIEVRKVAAKEGDERDISDASGELVTTETATETANTTVKSDNFGFMLHHNAPDGWNILNVGEGTEIETGHAAFLVKKVNAEINLDKASVKTGDGVILQMIDNDDDMVGAFAHDLYGMPTFNYKFEEKPGWSSTWGAEYKSSGWQTELNVTDTTLDGDIYNGTGYTANGGMELSVNLGAGASLTGAISATEIQHKDKTFTYLDESVGFDYNTAAAAAGKLGHVDNQNCYNGVNDVNVTLTDDAAWKVTGDCVVTGLAARSAAVTADKAVTITVNGELTLDGEKVTGSKTVGNVTYTVKSSGGGAPGASPAPMSAYADLQAGWWVGTDDAQSIAYVIEQGLMGSVDAGSSTFNPYGTLTRQELALILYRASGSPAVSASLGSYADAAQVDDSAVDAMIWALDEGVLLASGGKCLPNEKADRQTTAAALYVWSGDAAVSADLSRFSDADQAADWAGEGLEWAVANGVLKGDGDRLSPKGDILRVTAAIMLGRYFQTR